MKKRTPPERQTKMLPSGPRRTYLGKRAGTPASADQEMRLSSVAAALSPAELKFLRLYYEKGSQTEAFRSLRKGRTVSDGYCMRMGSVMMKKIREKISEDDLWEAFGVSHAKIGKTIDEGMSATFVRDFIGRDGTVYSGPERPDFQVRQQAVSNAMKLRKLDKSGESDQPINVNLILYADPRAPKWPGSDSPDDQVIDVTPEERH